MVGTYEKTSSLRERTDYGGDMTMEDLRDEVIEHGATIVGPLPSRGYACWFGKDVSVGPTKLPCGIETYREHLTAETVSSYLGASSVDLMFVDFVYLFADYFDHKFYESGFLGARFSAEDVLEIIRQKPDFYGSRPVQLDLTDVDFSGIELDGLEVMCTGYLNVDFTGAVLRNANIKYWLWFSSDQDDFSEGALLEGVVFTNCNVSPQTITYAVGTPVITP